MPDNDPAARPGPPRYTLIACNCRFSHSAPVLFTLRNAIKRYIPTAAVTIEQYSLSDPAYAVLQRIAGSEADAFFLSTYVWNHDEIRGLAADLRQLLPRAAVIIGGPEATRLQLTDGGVTIVEGEAEGLNAAFYADLYHRRLQPRYQAGRPSHFPSPYRREDFSRHLKNRHIYYEASRGCPFRCSYCLSAREKGVRYKELDQVWEELPAIIAQRPLTIRFVDRTFNAQPDRALAIWNFLVRQAEPGLTFHFEAAPDLFTDDMLRFLNTVPPGLFQFELGIQSLHRPVLAAINRTMDPQRALTTIAALAAMERFHLHADLILGLPGDNGDTFRESFTALYQAFPHYIQMGLLKVLPGTPLGDSAEDLGLIYRRSPPYEILATPWMDQGELRELYWFGRAVETFFNSGLFRNFFRYLREKPGLPTAFFTTLAQDLIAIDATAGNLNAANKAAMLTRSLNALFPDNIALELLRYDWHTAGHARLPTCLQQGDEEKLRHRLQLQLPASLAPMYTDRTRNFFMSRAAFLAVSSETAVFLGMGGEAGIVALPPHDQHGPGGKGIFLTYDY